MSKLASGGLARVTLLAAMLAVALLAFPREALPSDDGLVVRIFDVRQMTSAVDDRPGPSSMGVSTIHSRDFGEGPFESRFEGDSGSESREMTAEELQARIEEMLPGFRDAEGATLRILNGRLHARLDARMMKKLEALLEAFCASWNAPVGVRAVLFEPGSEGDAPVSELDDSAAARLISAAQAQGKWSESISLCGMNNRRFHAVKGCQSVYLSEYDVEVASGTSIDDPVMGTLETGVMLDLRPNLSADGSTCTVTLRASCSFAASGRELVNVDTPAGVIQKPDLRTVNFQTTLTVKTGGWVLLSSGGAQDTGAPAQGAKGFRLLLKIDRLSPR